MAGNRKAAEAVILDGIEKILPGSKNKELYQNAFSRMSDEEFDQFMQDLESGKVNLAIIETPYKSPRLSVERNLKIAKEWGHNFFERIWIDEGEGKPKYLSNDRYLIINLNLRRQAQILIDKIAIPKHTNTIDDLTGQPTGESKGSRVSYPEIQVLAALGLDNCLTEMLKYRGGDVEGFRAMNNAIDKTGAVRLEELNLLGTEVQATRTLSTYLTGMHLSNTL